MTCRDLSKSKIGRCYYCPIIDDNGNLVKNSTTHIIIGSGHMIMIEKAFEMREKILEFLKK